MKLTDTTRVDQQTAIARKQKRKIKTETNISEENIKITTPVININSTVLTVQYRTVQHSTAQYSTMPYRIAQHSTAQCSTG